MSSNNTTEWCFSRCRLFRLLLLAAACQALCIVPLHYAGGDTLVPTDRRVSDDEARAALAGCEAASGHFVAARDQYRVMLQSSNVSWTVRMSFAGASLQWGDFDSALAIYRDYLGLFPDDVEIRIKMAEVYLASQQFEYAEALYREMLVTAPDDRRLLLSLARTRQAERDFETAVEIIDQIPSAVGDTPSVLSVRAECLLDMGRAREAAATFIRLAGIPEHSADGLFGSGLAQLELGNRQQALIDFKKALEQDPGNTMADFHVWLCSSAEENAGLPAKLLKQPDALLLLEWAELCRMNGLLKLSEQCLERALEIDPSLTDAQFKLAGVLAQTRRFDQALGILSRLCESFPESELFHLQRARVLSWARRYDESIRAYTSISQNDPANPVPVREMARVAGWAKEIRQSEEYYETLFLPALDSLLQQKLESACGTEYDSVLDTVMVRAVEDDSAVVPYDSYEAIFVDGTHDVKGLPERLRGMLDTIRTELYGVYRIQKAAYLELQEKRMTWRRRYMGALKACRALVEFTPGNREALYDLSQLEFATGLHREAVQTTSALFELDPSHNLSPMVLERMDIRNSVFLCGSASMWHENGRGDLVDIRRWRFGAGAGMPLAGRGDIRASGLYWRELPAGASFDARGLSLDADTVIAAWLAANGNFTFKDYVDSEPDDTETGHAEAVVNMMDAITLRLRGARSDELYNEFGIREKIQSDTLSLRGRSYLTRNLELGVTGRLQDYSDDNSGKQAYADVAWGITEHPLVFKGGLFAEARDTDRETTYVYSEDNNLVDIVHPYWTPDDYRAWGITLECYHDVSPVYSRGTDLRFYDLRVTLKDDNEENPAMELRGKLHWEFAYRWYVGLDASLMRSGKWDAEGLWAALQRSF